MSDPITLSQTAEAAQSWTVKDYMYLAGAIVSSVSATIAIVGAYMTVRRDRNSTGDSEIKMFELISKSETELVLFSVQIKKEKDSSSEEYKMKDADRIKLNFLVENLLNAYDIACQRYLDSKLDRKRFEKTYSARIEKLCRNPLYVPIIEANKIQYSALIKSNIIINDLEN